MAVYTWHYKTSSDDALPAIPSMPYVWTITNPNIHSCALTTCYLFVISSPLTLYNFIFLFYWTFFLVIVERVNVWFLFCAQIYFVSLLRLMVMNIFVYWNNTVLFLEWKIRLAWNLVFEVLNDFFFVNL